MQVNLILFKKDGNTKIFSLPSSVTTVGRRRDCDLCIPLMAISRKHCELNTDQSRLMVRDLGSKNGTFLNGNRIEEAVIKAGDHLRLGSLDFCVQVNGQPDFDEMKPEDLSASRAIIETVDTGSGKTEEAFEDMLHDLDDFDLNQTMGHAQANEKADQSS